MFRSRSTKSRCDATWRIFCSKSFWWLAFLQQFAQIVSHRKGYSSWTWKTLPSVSHFKDIHRAWGLTSCRVICKGKERT